MITICKGDLRAQVPSGSYKSLFKPYGWMLVEGPTEPAKACDEPNPGMDSGDELEAITEPVEATEDNLDKMSDKALRRYASMLGINTQGLKTREELRGAIDRAPK